jgi:hypothetical protein
MNPFLGLLAPCRRSPVDRHKLHPEILALIPDWTYARDVAAAVGHTVSYASVTLHTMELSGLVESRQVHVPWAKPLVNQYRRIK